MFTEEYRSLSQKELDGQLLEQLFHFMDQSNIEKGVKLIILGANINTRNRFGNTALHRAILYGSTEIARLLLLCNTAKELIDICIEGKKYFMTPQDKDLYMGVPSQFWHPSGIKKLKALDFAKKYGHTEVIELLNKYSATKTID